MTAFYAIPSVHRQKDVSIRAFSMALQSPLKGDHYAGFFLVLGVYRVLTLKPDSQGVKHAIAKLIYDGVPRHPICPPPKGRPHTSISHGATEFSERGVLMPDSGGVRYAITKPFYINVLHHPHCRPPKGRPHTSIFHGATEFSEIPGALGMRSRSPFTTGFYAIPSVHRQKDIPIRAFSMALQILQKGESLCQVFLDVWNALTLKPDSGGVRHAILKPFYDGVLCHPICLPPKGHPHTSIFHGATESSEGESLCQVFLVLGVYRALTLKPDSGGVKHAIAKPFYDGVLCHPICPLPNGRPHTSISHGATEFSEGGVLMPGFLSADFIARFRGRWACHHEALLRRRSTPSRLSTVKRASPYEHFPLPYRPDSWGVRHAIVQPFYDGVLHHPGCPPSKGRLHRRSFHHAIAF
ncbi:hypothetical protein B9Z19DRAFT_1136405 [Tuber borchii]|uniref:Uncharacterized protein n=1 Tax=Tuber borchii TaxID=42251 RepID=A0A2T6ZBP2_TUBBO|nr:hypothetical protein B9Z19DRAFT_1136405 [Tuber borchii]